MCCGLDVCWDLVYFWGKKREKRRISTEAFEIAKKEQKISST